MENKIEKIEGEEIVCSKIVEIGDKHIRIDALINVYLNGKRYTRTIRKILVEDD